jgi:hypothetical protein
VLLLRSDGSGNVPVQRADMSDVPAVREPLPVRTEAERAGVREAEAAGEARIKSAFRAQRHRVRASPPQKGRTERGPSRRTTVLRQLILSAVLAVSTPLAVCVIPTGADASPPAPQSEYRFEVRVYRDGHGWQREGTYRLRAEARKVALRLWQEGYKVEIGEL